ncbi:MAG TPA: hypothetical protein VFB22_17260 [Candidatus Baltobacteraceae bacterium]|nr:hypothetical protein [Candidatus Baltobacteraceae bacterium]
MLRSALGAGFVALGACAGPASRGVPCPQVVHDIQWSMIQPPNGATGVSVELGTIVVPGGPNAPTGAAVFLTPSPEGAPPVEGGTFVAQANGTDAAAVPSLTAATTYTVSASMPQGAAPCPPAAAWSIGSFTTQ